MSPDSSMFLLLRLIYQKYRRTPKDKQTSSKDKRKVSKTQASIKTSSLRFVSQTKSEIFRLTSISLTDDNPEKY